MSEFANQNIGEEAESLEVSPRFSGYSGVELVVSDKSVIFKGSRSGRVLTVENPSGTEEMANAILASISGFQYQPFTASGALLDPAAEIGDSLTVNGVYSGVYRLHKEFSPLMATNIEGPSDEEIDHEYHYESKQEREFKREIENTRAEISVTSKEIAAEVTRATAAEGTLQTRITQTAGAIEAKVSKSGGKSSSFGWILDDDSWELKSNNTTVFKATKNGIEVRGKITATSGFIGNGEDGFTIKSNNIRNGMTSLNDKKHDGVYVGTDGIALGKGAFKVTSSGMLTAVNATLTGTLTIGDKTITADTLRQGAADAAAHGGTWSTGSGYGIDYNNAQKPTGGTYPTFFKVNGSCQLGSLSVGGWPVVRRTLTINGVNHYVWTWKASD